MSEFQGTVQVSHLAYIKLGNLKRKQIALTKLNYVTT